MSSSRERYLYKLCQAYIHPNIQADPVTSFNNNENNVGALHPALVN